VLVTLGHDNDGTNGYDDNESDNDFSSDNDNHNGEDDKNVNNDSSDD